jgi:hypothetical protein
VQPHLRGADAAAQARDFGAGDEVAADALPQEIHPQVDRAHLDEAVHDLLGGLGGVLVGDGQHQRAAAHGVQRGGNHAAVQPAVVRVADEFGPHVEAHQEVGPQSLHLQPQHLVERDVLLDQSDERGVEAGLFGGAANRGRRGRGHGREA